MKRMLGRALFCAMTVILLMAFWPGSVSAAGIAIYVHGSFVDDEINHTFNTIQKGINHARDGLGDTVYVYSGTYNEKVYINKAKVTLCGQSRSQVTVNGGGQGYTIEIAANTVTVRQLRITGASQAGVCWNDPDYGTLENCDITGNTIGVLLYRIDNQTVKCNNVHNNSSDGIQVYDSSLKDVIRNNVYGNGNDGISLLGSDTIVVARNKSYNNTGRGIYVSSGSTNNDVYLNDFYGNVGGNGYSAGSNNNWQTPHTPYFGNYWGDYEEPGPYPLGSEQDDYPLMSSHVNYTPSPEDEVPQCTSEQQPPEPPGGYPVQQCFIATAACGPDDGNVKTLRAFRDAHLMTDPTGRGFVSAYYRLSPPVAQLIDDHPALKPIVRAALLPAVSLSTAAVSTSLAWKTAIAGAMILASVLVVLRLRRKAALAKL